MKHSRSLWPTDRPDYEERRRVGVSVEVFADGLLASADGLHLRRPLSRQAVLRQAAAATFALGAQVPTASARMSTEELERLDEASKTMEGVLLPSGVRVIDLAEGDGPLPSKGDRVCERQRLE